MRVVKFCLLVALVLCLALLSGCAAYNYPGYAKQQQTVYTEQAKAKATVAASLGQAAASPDARTRDMATMALLVMALTDKPLQIEAPREGMVERGLGALLSGLPYIGLSYVTLREMGNTAGTHNYNQNVSGTGNSALLNTGIGNFNLNPSTATPTIVTQPEPIVVNPVVVGD